MKLYRIKRSSIDKKGRGLYATEDIKEGSSLKLSSCNKNDKQKFVLQSDGKIQPKNNLNLCLTVSENYREGGGGNPVHLIRTLTLESCDDAISSRQKWGFRKTN